MNLTREVRLFQLHELKEFQLLTYENSKLYKEKNKFRHNAMIKRKHFLSS